MNALNQYSAVAAMTPIYDGNGNLTFDGTFTYGYDAENRLTSASGPGIAASYAYDPQGRRKSKTVNGALTLFVTDADNREVLEYDGTSGAVQRWFAYGLGPNDALNQMNVAAGTRATFIPDIQGSIVGTMDSATAVVAKVGYLPYGTSASTAGTFRYTGQRIDPETGGLHYYRARSYKPAWGRFMQADPIGYAAGANLYAYVGNDPLNLFDPLGLAADSPAWNQYVSQLQCMGMCHGFDPGTPRQMTPSESLALDVLSTAVTLAIPGAAPLGGARAAEGVWGLGWAARGQAIEQALGANLPSSFPVVDRFSGGVATSIKSMDLNATSYQNIGNLTLRLNSYVESIAAFNGARFGGSVVESSQITALQLQLAIPSGSASVAQQAAISAAAARAQSMGVGFKVTPFP